MCTVRKLCSRVLLLLSTFNLRIFLYARGGRENVSGCFPYNGMSFEEKSFVESFFFLGNSYVSIFSAVWSPLPRS